MLGLTAAQIARILQADLHGDGDTFGLIQRAVYDTRQLSFPADSIFLSIKGPRRNGLQFIQSAWQAGVRVFLVDELPKILPPEAVFILVPHVLRAIQQLAIYHRHRFTLPVVGITGSNGKTIVKEWLATMLQEEKHVARSPKSYNSQLGVPLSIFQLGPEHDLGIFEAGISKPGEMEILSSVIEPQTGIFTYLGEAHREGFSSREQKLKEKSLLFRSCTRIIYEQTNELYSFFTNEFPEKEHLTWSSENVEAGVFFENSAVTPGGTSFTIHFREMQLDCHIPFKDKAYVNNCFTCITYLLGSGYDPQWIVERIGALRPLEMRLEIKPGMLNSLVINDTYNSDIDSLNIAFNTANNIEPGKKKVFIVSDILQAGLPPEALYSRLAELINESAPEHFIGIGEKIIGIREQLNPNIKTEFYAHTSEFLKQFDLSIIRSAVVLLKGSRPFAMEHISEYLLYNRHESHLEINLDALTHNLKLYLEHIRPGTGIMVMVKASAYGSGAVEVARLLEQQKVDYLAVAYTEEGIELREAGIRTPIMVMNTGTGQFDRMVQYDLQPEIYSMEQLHALDEYLRSIDERMIIHLKLDTGMHRLGFIAAEMGSLISMLDQNAHFEVATIFSHLAASGEELHDEFTVAQIKRFEAMAQEISHQLNIRPARHILNSSGILRFPQYQFEMVRLGIGLYGIDPSEVLHSLRTVLSLKASITQIKTIPAGSTVGYSRGWTAQTESRIATISIGYADGLRRASGNGRWHVSINGHLAPVIGSVCMDMCMVDVTHLPHAGVGDEVVIFGTSPRVDALARCWDTIPYEVITGLSQRLRRTYVME